MISRIRDRATSGNNNSRRRQLSHQPSSSTTTGSPESMPRLTKAHSGSTLSSESPPHSKKGGSFRGQQTFRKNHNNHHHRNSSKKNDPPDSSILKGAEIIRRQLSDVGQHPYHPHHHRVNGDEDWDPWKIPTSSHSLDQERRQEENQFDYDDDDDDIPITKNQLMEPWGKTLNESSNIQDVSQQQEDPEAIIDHNNDEDTFHVLEKARSFYESIRNLGSKSFSSSSRSDERDQGERQYPKEDTTKSSKKYIVERVSDIDNSTFSSMFASSSYLPEKLLPANCGKGINQDQEEELETSTLDYIASLYVGEQESKGITSELLKCSPKKDQSSWFGSFGSNEKKGRNLRGPRVTVAAAPFQKMVAPSSYFYNELLRDPAYQHALQAGTLWQSLCSQHVRFPALWWDGQEPGGPPLGTPEKPAWSYLGRHRVKDDRKLNSLIGNRGSSGRLLLHLIVCDIVSNEPIEDICCGCFHPNARGVRTTPSFNPAIEGCRDVWIAHRRRTQGETLSSIESLLQHQNKKRTFESPLGAGPKGQSHSEDIHNGNLKAVFGAKPPLFTVFVKESELYELFQSSLDGSSPASVVLLRQYLRYRIG